MSINCRSFISIEYTNEQHNIRDSNERYSRDYVGKFERFVADWVSYNCINLWKMFNQILLTFDAFAATQLKPLRTAS